MPDYLSYQKSISAELLSEKDRIRNFIDAHHWGEDGRFKEIILKDCIRNKLPCNVNIGTGFVVGNNLEITTQIDLIVYRSEIPALFQKDEFVILPKEAVLGIIEVKTKLKSDNIQDTFRKCHENGRIIGNHIFNGIFSYEGGFSLGSHLTDSVKNCCERYYGYINNVSFSPDYFMKYWTAGHPNYEPGYKYRIYHLKNLSFGYFISNLIEDVFIQTQQKSLPETLRDLFYPVEGTKESYQYIKHTIPVNRNE